MSAVAKAMDRWKTLDALLSGMAEAPAVEIRDITLDSRRVTPGAAFFACAGTAGHGLDYVDEAVRAGAAAIVWEPAAGVAPPTGLPIPAIPVPALRSHLGAIAERWFGAPSADLDVIGITGTNGKTSVSWLLADALNRLDRRCAYLGTLGAGFPDRLDEATLTTPDVIELHRRLAAFAGSGADTAAIEVSSHALDQGRTDAVRLAAAAFVNLSRDHLDYHGSMEAYGEAKAKLLATPGLRRRVINIDDAFGARLARRYAGTALAVTRHDAAWAGRRLAVSDVRLAADGIRFAFTSPAGNGRVHSGLRGEFNVENLAIVLGLLLEIGVPAADAARVLGEVSAPPGRLQTIGAGRPLVVVDYAHTPGALESVLAALRPHCRGRLWCVFGCGGDRDRGKRPLMARAAAAADRVIVTSDNPRTEDPARIIDDILADTPAPPGFRTIVDRREAIREAIAAAAPDDCVLIAGRGHERFQMTAAGPRPLDDAAEALAALRERAAE